VTLPTSRAAFAQMLGTRRSSSHARELASRIPLRQKFGKLKRNFNESYSIVQRNGCTHAFRPVSVPPAASRIMRNGHGRCSRCGPFSARSLVCRYPSNISMTGSGLRDCLFRFDCGSSSSGRERPSGAVHQGFRMDGRALATQATTDRRSAIRLVQEERNRQTSGVPVVTPVASPGTCVRK
jgi:hypothetical protein